MTIHEFTGRARILFFPKKWANAIVRWIAGIHSPTGTIKVTPNMAPGDNGSLALDVSFDAIAPEILRRIDTRPVEKPEMSRLAMLLQSIVDEVTVYLNNNRLSVSAEWVEAKCREVLEEEGSSSSLPEKLSNLLSYLNASGKVSITGLLGSSDNGTRLVKVNNSGGFGYSTADEYKALVRLAADYYNSTDDDYSFADFAANATKENCLLVGTDANGKLKRACSTPSATVTYDKVLVMAANGTSLSLVHQREVGRAVNPGSSVVLLTPSVNTSSADTTTWTAGGTNGVVVRRYTRTRWNGTTLYGFYRDETYDRYGRLYSVSAETRYTIDTPVVATWS